MVTDIEKNEINNRNTSDAIYFNFSYAALKLLGKNLYNNAANAISELVANGLDAKAKNVYVYIDMSDKEHSIIEIIDDGIGMDYADLARKYVWIGRNKRNDADLLEDEKKNVMGRKGIGKLAALYLSNNYYILTKKEAVEKVDQWEINLSAYNDSDFPKLDRVAEKICLVNNSIWEKNNHGTAIVLNNVDLRRNGTKRIEALKRVFADFYLVDELSSSIYVAVKTNKSEKITFEKVDKFVAFKNFYAIYDNTTKCQYKKLNEKIAFSWLSKYPHIANKKRETIIWQGDDFKHRGKKYFKTESGDLIEKEYELTGWIGVHATIESKNALDEKFIRNDIYQPNRLRIYVRNKLAVADFFEMHPSTQVSANYVEGDITFNILDDDDLPDIATSSRQDFLDDERVELLISILDPIVNAMFKARTEIGQKIRSENEEYEKYLKKQEEEKRKKEEEARKKAEEQAREAEQKQKEAEQNKKEAEEKQKKAEERAEKERQRARYILNVSGVEDKNIMNSIHSIYNMSNRVKENLDDLSEVVQHSDKGMKKLEKAVMSNQRILSVSKIISKAGMIVDNNDASKQVQLNLFISEYANDVLSCIYDKSDIDIECNVDADSEYTIKLKPLSFIMMMDNIVGNAIKANATKLRIVVDDKTKEYHIIKFIDNGDGIDKSIDDIGSLFEFGVTTTNGSGLGLFYAKKYMNDLKGEIEIVPNEDKGISVVLKFNKQKK
ncbi:hypothetical protein DXB77_01390 [Clostridium sp. OM05-9]|uniref:ATP-binding protein n=1 Tax=Clostridium sp. OM05-9 TaxID=2293045 RepID=UPI000E51C1FD|nr:ATP-binding protein [Clostridium sp. OM05-9]RHV14110.1 hypothetical protein DXB77_01390 [Clostridium sp. OM05-9]